MIPAQSVAAWFRARGRHVVFAAGTAIASPVERFRPLPSSTLLVTCAHRPASMLHLLIRVQATWAQHERCWTFSMHGSELDDFRRRAALEGHAARVGLLALGGADRAIPKAPRPPSGLFAAPTSLIEAGAVRSFGRGDDRRLLMRVAGRPWRCFASLDALALP